MKVTLLMPIYNVASYIEECAESLFKQTYKDIEYIFVDDCSPDNSIELLNSVIERHPERHNHIQIIRHERNKGLGGARRTAIDYLMQHTEDVESVFAIVDSDDVLTPSAIELMVKRMQATGADVVDGAYCEYKGGKTSPAILPFHGNDREHQRRILCQNVLNNRVWGKLYRTSKIKELKEPFVEGIDYSEDYCFIGRLCNIIHREWIDDVVYLYRTDNISSYTKNMNERSLRSFLRANKMVYDYYKHSDCITLPCEIGMLNAYRVLRNNGASMTLADECLGYIPQSILTKSLAMALRRNLPCSNIIYKVVRTIASR